MLKRQEDLLEENNRILHKLRRYQVMTFVFTMAWYALLVGLPFALYYYVLGPYFEALGFSDGGYGAMWQEFPIYEQFQAMFGGGE